jgi:hypothetical protein
MQKVGCSLLAARCSRLTAHDSRLTDLELDCLPRMTSETIQSHVFCPVSQVLLPLLLLLLLLLYTGLPLSQQSLVTRAQLLLNF